MAVKLNPEARLNETCRMGTYRADKKWLECVLGSPHSNGFDEKTTMEWFFDTRYGTATLYDYWWNQYNEWSIGACDERAVEELVRFLDGLKSL